MIELMEVLRLIQWQPAGAWAWEETCRVVRAVEQTSKFQFPARLREDGKPAVDGLGDLGISPRPEDWTGLGGGVEQGYFGSRQGKLAVFLVEVLDPSCESVRMPNLKER
jgi:hypothetical protein